MDLYTIAIVWKFRHRKKRNINSKRSSGRNHRQLDSCTHCSLKIRKNDQYKACPHFEEKDWYMIAYAFSNLPHNYVNTPSTCSNL